MGLRVGLALGAVLWCASSALADHAVARGGTLVVNGVPTFSLASSRTAAIARSINNAPDNASVSVKKLRRAASITLGEAAILTVTRSEAKSLGATAYGLASRRA